MNELHFYHEGSKLMVYFGISIWIGVFFCYLCGLFLKRFGKIYLSSDSKQFLRKSITVMKKLIKIPLIFISIRSLVAVYEFLSYDKISMESCLTLICLLIPAYFIGLATLYLLEIMIDKTTQKSNNVV